MRASHRFLFLVAIPLLVVVANANAEVASIAPQQDNTLYESNDGSLSNGVGQGLFSGFTVGRELRRALIAFDIASNIPAGASIINVQLQMNVSQRRSDGHTATLHRLTTQWGEGNSNSTARGGGQGAPATPMDATWLHALFNTSTWTTPGGDFQEQASASALIDGPGPVLWGSNSGMVADVQAWLDQPQTNFGWIVRTDEETTGSAKRFDSREHLTEANRPVLLVTYQGTAVEHSPWSKVKALFR